MKPSVPQASRDCVQFAERWIVLCLSGLMLAGVSFAASPDWPRGERPLRAALSPSKELGVQLQMSEVGDPVGDTFGDGSVLIDITGMSAELAGRNLLINLTFANAISPPDSDLPNAIDGFIDIDVDQNGSTGRQSNVDALRPDAGSSALGNEFYVDLFTYDSDDGAADLVDDLTQGVAGRAPVNFNANSMTVQIPLSLLGDAGAVNTAAVLGTLEEPTDIVPNQGSVASATPITLHNGRFEIQVEWADFDGNLGLGKQVVKSDESAVLYFFDEGNWEVLVKVLDGCAINDHYWIFFAATTNVEHAITITDTRSESVKRYTNPIGQPADTILDTQAFATCP